MEAAVPAAWLFLQDLDSLKVVVKLDFRNAFKAIYRDKMLVAVLEQSRELYPFCILPTLLHLHFFGVIKLSSQRWMCNRVIL